MEIPNEFIQTNNPIEVGYQRYIMKIRGKMAYILLEIAPEVYGPYTTYENGKEVLYLKTFKALYGMLICIITILPKVEEGYYNHWFQSKSL